MFVVVSHVASRGQFTRLCIAEGAAAEDTENTVFTPNQAEPCRAVVFLFCFESHKKYRKHGLCHRASFRKPESMCEVEQEGDANTLSTGGILGSSPGPSSSGDWLSLVTDNTRFHFQVTRLSFYHFSSAFTLLS